MKISVKEMTESAMLIALAILLDLPFLKIRIGIGGGSISLSMLPLLILAIRVGFLKSLIGIGIIYGFITCLLDGWGLVTFPFDYFVGYGSLSLLGLFKNKILQEDNFIKGIIFIVLGCLLATFGRFVGSMLSSLIIYEYSFKAALIYNAAYLLPSAGITLVILICLYKPLLLVNRSYPLKSIC